MLASQRLAGSMLLLIVAAFFAPATGYADDAAARDKPNILLIVIDDLNDWIGVMDAHPNAKTPNMDRLAQRGTLFTNAHASAPLCGPTRATLLTGLNPSTTGIYGHNDFNLLQRTAQRHQVTLLPMYFSEHGYKTMSTGKIFHEGSPPQAFDEVGIEQRDFGPRPRQRMAYTPPDGRGTGTDWGAFPQRDERMPDYQYAQWAVEKLQEEHQRPFLLCVGFVRPHVPWHVPQKWFDKHPLDDIVLPPYREDDLNNVPETARRFADLSGFPQMQWMQQAHRWEKAVQAYLACTTFVDHYVGVVLDALAESRYADNTVVVLVSDHGYHLGEKGIWAKHTLWERSTRSPLIIARPGDSEPRRTHQPASHLDIFPTLLDLAGLSAHPRHEGRSLVPLLDDPDAEGFDAVLTTHGYGNHAVRTQRWRYIRYADGAQELYDHDNDPNEWHNLAGQAQYARVIAELRRHLPRTNAPWLPGTERGATYNDYLAELFERHRADR